jgi:hypothetical protein
MTQIPPLLKRKYPKAKYAPRPGCQYCNGRGEVNGKQGMKPCVCIFVSPTMVDHAMKILPAAFLGVMGIDVEALKGKVKP